MRKLAAILIVILFVGCYNSADKPSIISELPTATTTIARLHDVVGSGGVTLDKGIIVHGRVVSSDVDDNFYRTLVVESDSRAVEVMMGMNGLDALYPVGLEVALRLGGCYVDYGYGVLQVGRKGTGGYAVDYLASREAMDRVVVRSTDVKTVVPRDVTIAELDKRMCGTLVRIEGLSLVAAESVDEDRGESLDDARWSGYTLFKDKYGDSIALYTRDYARFAQKRVPRGEVAITGIMQWGKYDGGKECFQLKMRYEEDCATR